MTISIPSVKALIKESALYDGDLTKKDYLPCEIIAISAYSNSPLTFTVLVEGGYLYSDVLITSLVSKIIDVNKYSLKGLSYLICPSPIIEVFTLEHFKGIEVFSLLKYENEWERGIYITSVEFINDNELLHLIKLNMGNFAFVPNHKINWNDERKLSDYKKNHQTYNW